MKQIWILRIVQRFDNIADNVRIQIGKNCMLYKQSGIIPPVRLLKQTKHPQTQFFWTILHAADRLFQTFI